MHDELYRYHHPLLLRRRRPRPLKRTSLQERLPRLVLELLLLVVLPAELFVSVSAVGTTQ
jgi:hypothetical protein